MAVVLRSHFKIFTRVRLVVIVTWSSYIPRLLVCRKMLFKMKFNEHVWINICSTEVINFTDEVVWFSWILASDYNSYKKSNKMQQCIKIYFIFIWSSTCFGWHTAHHQEPKTALRASGFACVEGCWTCSCWMLSAFSDYTFNILPRMQNQRLLVQF